MGGNARRVIWLALIGIVLMVACATTLPRIQRDGTTTVVPTPPRLAYVAISNSNWSLVRVYLSENGNTPYRIGSVETGRREVIAFRVNTGSRYSFALYPLASSDGYATESIAADVGDTIRLSIADHLNFTTVIRQVR